MSGSRIFARDDVGPLPTLRRVTIAFLLLASAPARGDEPLYVEPIAFEEVRPTDPGEWDIRLTFEIERERESGDYLLAVPLGQIFVGIAERVSVDAALPFALRIAEDRTSGIGDIGLGVRYLLVPQRGRVPSASASVETRFPTGDENRGLGEGSTEVEGSIGVAAVFDALVVQATVGYAVSSEQHTLVSGVSIAVPLTRVVYGFGEALADLDVADPGLDIVTGPGIKVLATRDSFVAATALVGLADEPSWRALLQLQLGF